MKSKAKQNTIEDYWTKTSKLMHFLQGINYKVSLPWKWNYNSI